MDFIHDPGPTGKYYMPQSMGSGAAAFDSDNDGLTDFVLLNFGDPSTSSSNRFFRQVRPGRFEDHTAGSGIDLTGRFHGITAGDVNNDGRVDLLFTGPGSLTLLLNRGNGLFVNATADSGLMNPQWGMSAAFVDFDRDGWLDLFVTNYLDYDPKVECRSPEGVLDFCGPNSFPGTPSRLFRNRGPGPIRFEDISLNSGIGKVRGPGLGVTIGDFNGDGWPDIFVANDGKANCLWINQKNSTFLDEAISRGVAYNSMGKAYAGMGIARGDVNGDGLQDLYVTHLGSELNNLWRQGPRGAFRDRTFESRLASPKWKATGFGVTMGDFNLDGHLDIAVVNGKVFRGGSARGTNLGFWETYAERNQLFTNDGTGMFQDVSEKQAAFCGVWNVGRGLVQADFDNDGAPDLLVTSIGDRTRLFRNITSHENNWLTVRALDPRWQRDAYGAEVRISAGGKEQMRLIDPSESYLCSSLPLAYFGLGKADNIDWIRIKWPDGSPEQEVFPGGTANRSVVVRHGEGQRP